VRFLADESCDFAVVRRLRAEGHDVAAVRDLAPGTADDAVVDIAVREQRILLTEDKDFG
jgi:predicted nuclease of predicted toxin-antitoxin system